MIFCNGNSFFGDNTPEGLIDNISGGINFNYDFNEDLEWTSNYFLLNNYIRDLIST